MSLPAGAEWLLETLRGESGVALRWRLHAERMGRSAAELKVPFSIERFADAATRAASETMEAPCRIRITLDKEGRLVSEALPLPPVPDKIHLVISEHTISSDSPFSRHKLVPRGTYDLARREAEAKGAWDGILINERGELCEAGRANLVLVLDGELLTPALSSGVLQGTVRRVLLEAGAVREGVLPKGRLAQASALFVTNALIGVQEVSAVEGAYSPQASASPEALASLRAALLK